MENDNELLIDDSISSLENFCKMLNKFDKIWNAATKEVSQTDAEICDLLHEIENCPFNVFEGFRLCQQLHTARARRRKAKNLVAALAPVKKYYDNHRSMEVDLFKVCKETKAFRHQQLNWTYRPRVREDLKICRLYDKNKEEKKPSA